MSTGTAAEASDFPGWSTVACQTTAGQFSTLGRIHAAELERLDASDISVLRLREELGSVHAFSLVTVVVHISFMKSMYVPGV